MIAAARYRVTPYEGRIHPADDVSEVYREIAFPAMRRLLRAYLSGR